MNLAVGFPCPTCGHREANLIGIERDRNAHIVGFRLHCAKCESVFRELRDSHEEPRAPVGSHATR